MRKIITILAVLMSTMMYSQTDSTNVETCKPDYRYQETIRTYEPIRYLPRTYRDGTSVYIRGNFNRVRIQRRERLDYNYKPIKVDNSEYNKTNSFNPDKTLQEILSEDKK